MAAIRRLRAPCDFNPRSLAGATVWDGVVLHEYEFQSTLPRGSDVPAHHHRSCVADFNPRSLAGATSSQSFCFCCRYISIHAPSRERLVTDGSTNTYTAISIHAPSRERPTPTRSVPSWYTHFNPRSLAGATYPCLKSSVSSGFQSTLPRGSDKTIYIEGKHVIDISIHAPSRERLRDIFALRNVWLFQSTLPRGSDVIRATFNQ